MPSEVGQEDHEPLLTRRSVVLLVCVSGAMATAVGGVAFAVGLSLQGAFMIGMLSVAVFSAVTAVYKDMRKRR